MKAKLSRNALIGLAFIVSLFMIYFGVNFLKGFNVLKNQNQYYARFDDVSKLLISSPVYVKGYQIGLVNKIELSGTNPMRFTVGLNLTENIQIPKGSRLEYGLDLFGASTVNLIMGLSSEYLQRGDTLTGGKESGWMDGVAAVVPRTDSLLLRVDALIGSLHKLVANPAWEQSVEEMSKTMEQLHYSSVNLNKIIASLERELPGISADLSFVTSNLKEVTRELSEIDMTGTFTSIDETVSNLKMLTDRINRDDSSLGLLLNERELYDSLSVTLDTAARLLEDIRLNPDRYLSIRLKLF